MVEIQKLFRIEDKCDETSMGYYGRRAAYRNEHAHPILDGMKEWMERECLGFSPKTQIEQAVTYAYIRWDAMYAYLKDGRIRLHNNLSKNEIRPITLGRKNWMFCGNHSVNLRDYLNGVISTMPYMSVVSHGDLVALLPHRWKLSHHGSVMVDFRATQRKK